MWLCVACLFFSYETLLLILCRWVCHMFFKSLQKIINSFELKSLCMTPWLSTQPPISAKPLIDTYAAANQFILHLNASETNLITQGGRGRNLLTTISSWSIVFHSSKVKLLFCSSSVRILFYSFISLTSCLTNLSAFFLFRSTLLSSKFFFRARFTLMVSLGCFCFCSFFVFYGKNSSTWALPEFWSCFKTKKLPT